MERRGKAPLVITTFSQHLQCVWPLAIAVSWHKTRRKPQLNLLHRIVGSCILIRSLVFQQLGFQRGLTFPLAPVFSKGKFSQRGMVLPIYMMGKLNIQNPRGTVEQTKCLSNLGFLLVVIGFLFLNESDSFQEINEKWLPCCHRHCAKCIRHLRMSLDNYHIYCQ